MSKKSKKSKKSKYYGAHYEQETNHEMAFWGVVAIILLVLMVLCAVGMQQRTDDTDTKVQANVQESVSGLHEWTSFYPDTIVPKKIVTGIYDGRQSVTTPYGLTDPSENSRRSVPVYAEPGNTLIVKPRDSTGSYTICGYSPVGGQFSSEASAVVYDSSTGETRTGVPCP